MIDLYGALDIGKSASADDVRKAYRKKAKATHPDTGGSVETFALVKLAYDTLKDDARRARYDQTGQADGGQPDQSESAAMQHALRAIEHVIAQILTRHLSLSDIDVIADAVRTLEREQETLRKQAAELESMLASTQKIAKRFKAKKDKPNHIKQMMDAKIADIQRGIAAKDFERAPFKRAIEILKDHTYDMSHEPRPAGYDKAADLQFLMREAMKPGPIVRDMWI